MYAEEFDTNPLPELVVVEHAIMHHVDRDLNRTFTSREISLDGPRGEDITRLLTSIVARALAHAGSFGEAEEGSSSTLQACWETLQHNETLVANSLQLAETLDHLMRQNKNISPCDLLVALCRDSEGAFVAILKLERMEELECLYERQGDGSCDAILIPKQVVPSKLLPQKSAFIRDPSVDRGYDVQLDDNQVKKKTAANFFYKQFLGCRLLSTAAQQTIEFCAAAERWRGQHSEQLPKQGIVTFSRALQAYLGRPTISFSEFAEAALGAVASDMFAGDTLADTLAGDVYRSLRNMDEAPPPTFAPDAGVARRLLETMDWTLNNRINLVGPVDDIMALLEQAEEDGNGHFTLRIRASKFQRWFKSGSKRRSEQRTEP